LLHISPELVRLDEMVPGNRAPLADLLPAMRSGGVAAVSELGVLGDPTTATAVDGARFFAEMIDGCVGRIRRWRPDRDGMLA
jgi:creatinine amidohydrolase